MHTPASSGNIAFGPFELDSDSGELRKHGLRLKLAGQPIRILAILIEHAGELVARDQIRDRLWGDSTFIDYEHSLNAAVNRLREALGDTKDAPRYIETLPRRGYRFIGEAQPARQDNRKLTLAVLPFVNYSGDAEQEYFCDGFTEEMISQLAAARPDRLAVIARTSVAAYKRSSKPIDVVASELGAEYVVEGSVRSASGSVRITAQLIRASDQSHVWARSYERSLEDVFGVQVEVAKAVCAEVRVQLSGGERPAFPARRSVKPEAREEYLRGRYCLNNPQHGPLTRAAACFQAALATQPDYALAWAALAETHCLLGFGLGPRPPRVEFTEAKRAALRALELDPGLADARASLAWLLHHFDRNFAAAEEEFLNAIEISPNCANAHHWCSGLLMAEARFEEAGEALERARRLDPVSLAINMHRGLLFHAMKRFDEAAAEYLKLIDLEPRMGGAYALLGWTREEQGRYEEAVALLERAAELDPRTAWYSANIARAQALSGKQDQARRTLDELDRESANAFISPVSCAELAVVLGEIDRAYQYLERAIDCCDASLAYTLINDRLRPLHADPRFPGLLARLGIARVRSGKVTRR